MMFKQKILIVLIFVIYYLFNINIEQKKYISPMEQLFNVNELNFKIATNLYSTFYADKFWLLSRQIDEVSGIKNEKEIKKIQKGFSTINYMDPNFTQPIIYAVAYLIINEKKYKEGMKILNEAIKKSPNNPKLLFQKLIYITTYNPNKPSMEEAMKIAKILYEKEIIFMGTLKISDFVAEAIEFYTASEEEKIQNLKRLLKFTKNKEIKEDINTIIKKYNGEKNEK